MTYGKIINNQLITPNYISLERGMGISNPTDKQYIAHGYKEVIDIQPIFANYEQSYTETDTQIIVNYVEVVVEHEPWHEQTNFQIKFTTDDLLDMIEAVPQMADYTNSLTTYRDMMHRIFYVNFFNERERELITYYGGIVNERD